MSASTIGKILKGAGKGIGKDASKVVNKVKDVDYKKLGSKVFKEIDPEKSTSWIGEHIAPIQFTKPIQTAIAGTVVGSTLIKGVGGEAMNRAGNIRASIGPMDGMTGDTGVVTPGLKKMQEAMANGKKGPKISTRDTKVSTHGAEGDLVFALHNLR